MKLIRHILTLALLITAAAANAAITGQWMLHPTFDNSVRRVISTGKRVYFMGYNQSYNPAISVKNSTDQTLFYYDIEGDELIAANRGANLTETAVDRIEYNAGRGYLMIVYSNYDIDLLFDSGEVANIPALKHADIPGSKKVNSISFDSAHDNAWLATDFGYIVINDRKMEVEDSRNYGVPFVAAGRIGDVVMLVTESVTYLGDANEKRLNISDYTRHSDYIGNAGIYPLSEKRALINTTDAQHFNNLKIVEFNGLTTRYVNEGRVWGELVINPSEKGYIAFYGSASLQYTPTSDYFTHAPRPEIDKEVMSGATWDQQEYFVVLPRKGLHSFTADGTVTRDFMLPNAPNAYWSRGMAYHPVYGMLVNSHGVDAAFSGTGVNSISEPILLSALKDGNWTPMSPAYRNPEATQVGYNPLGLLIDPADSRYVWSGSNYSGITRLNLEDPKDILHYSFPGDPTSSLPGYVQTSDIQSAWSRLCHFSAPKLDAQNTLWCHFHNADNTNTLELRYMTDADRKASVNAASARPWQKLLIPDVASNLSAVFLPLTSSANRNLLLYIKQETIMVYNTNGTPGTTGDDQKATVTGNVFDQDGGEVSLYLANCAYEDPSTGFVWFGTSSGVYYLQPRSILKGQRNVNRIKVARNDGTSLADYLLNGVGVNSIIADPEGRKWFGSAGAGIVVTSSDGRNVLGEFTTSNSGIPSDNVYSLCYNPSSRSVMVSTDKGLAELFLGGASGVSDGEQSVRAYPNPVAPDYYGWVTIDGLPDNSLVKIVDAQGNLVRELGRAEAGSIQWDVNNLYNRRVKTGVYYILSSPASGSGDSNVAKILIMN